MYAKWTLLLQSFGQVHFIETKYFFIIFVIEITILMITRKPWLVTAFCGNISVSTLLANVPYMARLA